MIETSARELRICSHRTCDNGSHPSRFQLDSALVTGFDQRHRHGHRSYCGVHVVLSGRDGDRGGSSVEEIRAVGASASFVAADLARTYDGMRALATASEAGAASGPTGMRISYGTTEPVTTRAYRRAFHTVPTGRVIK